MVIKVVYTSAAPIEIDKSVFQTPDFNYIEKSCFSEDELIAVARDSFAAIIRSEPCTRKVIANLKECRLIMTPKVGYDNIDVAAATEAGICVANIKGLSVDEVSDHAMALLLASSRKLFILDKTVRTGGWTVFHGKEMQTLWQGISLLRGQTLGLIGFGVISRALVPKAKAFGLKVAAFDPYVGEDDMKAIDVEYVDLNRLLKMSDYISIHTPLNSGTRHMLGEQQFKTMKKTSYLINTSRGSVIDEKALYNALTNGYIAGAALDVFEKEPVDRDNPILQLSNVIVTGHSAHYSDQVWAEQARCPGEEINRVLHGSWPKSWVNPQVEANFNIRWGTQKSGL